MGVAQLHYSLSTVPIHDPTSGGVYVSVSSQDFPRKGPAAVSPWCEPFSLNQPASAGVSWRYPALMACFRPIEGYRMPGGGITWSPRQGFVDLPRMQVPCGQCLGCRLERGRQWTVRLMHEAQLHDELCFITLTYSDEHLPKGGTLLKSDFQVFIQKFRDAVRPKRVSYFMCGEYGERDWRPHYHAIIFGHDFGQRVYRRNFTAVPRAVSGRGKGAYSSEELARYWTKGFNAVGAVTPQSAGYVARYCLKKVTGVLADEHYKRVDPETGEVYWLLPEYAHMSTRPAIGKVWFDLYGSDVVAYDGVHVDGQRAAAPRYYDKLRERSDAERLREHKLKRRLSAAEHASDNTPDRLAVRERVAAARVNLFGKRKL